MKKFELVIAGDGALDRDRRDAQTAGVHGAELEGVFNLRTLQDSQRIREAAGTAARAVVVVGGFIGMEVTASLRRLGLDVTLVVSQRFETAAPGVYAAGDVANFFDPLYRRHRRIEHWSNANYQGTEVGKILAGQGSGYQTVSSFVSEVFGLVVKVFGDVSRFDELTTDGSLPPGPFLAGYGHEGRLVGALAVGQSEEVEARLNDLIEEQAPTRALHDDLVGSGRSR